ncbi:hemolysin family protein [Parageobacillus thermoglucosidasius]|uniref:HlyC/CorC family transporter n=1 Tax=Geobacillus sp. (strain Y4.1MC1) TaxID=581103 RepID=A0A7U3YHQ4_GEOS0|nr:hemolysin family protein [Parageobacillus thermoglucosidasius]MED4902958.1 hemolysin family protein [Parageobacillus thermoglucosidasius]MED4915249.1 hemolysin family protein [Parageobacillus thermoglucosidasius]MED4946172.1 hemolysin family protein [Parageobacillus thermoglucosidasius]MED4981770.1 hemolysin family protein [Parageobacillus thermoglucosidasius]RDE28735.1 HlyC/CorC family transporter [Parageobacillus thermoglucosidasius]
MDIVNLLIVALLIACTAFFVASEFAIVKVRSSRIDQLVNEGNKRAIAAKKVISNLDGYLSANQLGITMTSLGLGWLGEPTVERILMPLFERIHLSESLSHVLSFVIAFSTITFLHVVVGELAPKTFAIHKAEAITLFTAQPLILFYKTMYPFIWTLNNSARLVTKMFGLQPAAEHEIAHSEEELRLILSESYKSGEINQSEYRYVNNIFRFDDRVAKEIMVPRKEIVALDINRSVKENLEIIKEEKYTRYPVIDGDKDHVLGLINVKEVFTDLVTNPSAEKQMKDYIRPIIQVIESIAIHDLLVKMQKERIHMAILVDEYGGTSGLVTVEDILEEIVGEIQDEFDVDEIPLIQKVDETRTIVDGKVLISEVNDLFGLSIDDDDVDTIGGWILTKHYDIKVGDSVEIDNYLFTVKEMDGHHVKTVEILKQEKEEETQDDAFGEKEELRL